MSLNDEELQKLKELDPDLFSLIDLLSGFKIPTGEIGKTLEQINKNIENPQQCRCNNYCSSGFNRKSVYKY